jgi:hypothetical protein
LALRIIVVRGRRGSKWPAAEKAGLPRDHNTWLDCTLCCHIIIRNATPPKLLTKAKVGYSC